jgi:dihydropteroate synthase
MFTLNCKGRLLVIDRPLVMGIINITPDSFYEGSRFQDPERILLQAEKLIRAGADILDIGGQSTRPKSQQVTLDEELTRVVENIHSIHSNFPEVIISIDSYRSRVVKESVQAGASIVNDISAGSLDGNMLTTVSELQTPYVLMHMKGEPQTMQNNAIYENVTREVLDFFIQKQAECRGLGIRDLIIDPGFGFGKTIEHNFELVKNLAAFKMLDLPIMFGISRKSTIYKTLGISAEDALNGTTVLNTIGLMNGANILRVHDVQEAKEAVKLWSMIFPP